MLKPRAFAFAATLALLASPANLLLLRVEVLPGPGSLLMVVALDVAATVMLGRVVGSLSAAVLTVAVLNLPLLLYVGAAESGPWASVLATPKYLVQAALGWMAWARSRGGRTRWLSVCVSTAGALVAIGSWL
jgi:hypothetical protein